MAKTSANSSVANLYIKLQKLSNEATEKSFKYNAKEANTARTWQKMMSDTSHQREVADLKKAGLNPVLSANQGAQSYTTSSASGQAENPSNAIANVYGADRSAKATENAAATNAAAIKASAQASLRAASIAAAAQRYAADSAAAANKYGWDKKAEIQKGVNETQKWIAVNKQATNIVGAADKVMTAISKAQIKDVSRLGSKIVAGDFANKKGSINMNNFVLNRTGEKKANIGLNKLGLAQTRENRILYVKAFVYGDKFSMKSLDRMIYRQRRAAQHVSTRKSLYW